MKYDQVWDWEEASSWSYLCCNSVKVEVSEEKRLDVAPHVSRLASAVPVDDFVSAYVRRKTF